MLKKIIEFIVSLFKKKQDAENENVTEVTEVIETVEPVEEYAEDTDEQAITEENQTQIHMSKYSNIMVHIDNGHASSTPGKRSPYSACKVPPALDFYEYKFNREVAAILRSKLEALGFATNMVCPEVDEDIKLTVRANRANDAKKKNPSMSHLFVSVHSNACGKGNEWNSAKGWCAYTTKGQNNSDKFAECLYEAAEEILPKYGKTIRYDKTDGDKDYESNFTVIYCANMPAVLTENLFFTNIEETKFLLSDEGKDAIAEIHLRGIVKYAEKYILN